MARSNVTKDLTRALKALEDFAPFSTHPTRHSWGRIMLTLQGVEAVLLTMEAYAPGQLITIEQAAIEELQITEDELIEEIVELVNRYSSKQEAW